MDQSLDESRSQLVELVGSNNWREPTPLDCYDLIVLGGGTAGLVSAVGAASLGARVALIEKDLLGGDCLHTGCVPSKALLASGSILQKLRECSQFGISVGSVEVNFLDILQRISNIRTKLANHDSVERLSRIGVHVFFGSPTYISKNQIALGSRKLRFRRSLIATGSRPSIPTIPGLETIPFLTTSTLFQLSELPKKLIVLGGGPSGCELAQVFRQLGSQVTLVERSPRLIPEEDSIVSEYLQKSLRLDGVHLMLNTTANEARYWAGSIQMIVDEQGRQTTVEGTHLLVVAGRCPNAEDLGLELAGVQYDVFSGIQASDRMQTTNRRIFAAGDVCSMLKFTHAADLQARIVVRNALFGGRERFRPSEIPYCIYTHPEVAHVGIHESTAQVNGVALDTLSLVLEDVDRAVLEGTTGIIRVHLKRGTDRILGASIVAERASEMISQFAFAMKNNIGLAKLGSTVQPYPTYGNAVRQPADQFNRRRLTPMTKRILSHWHVFNRTIDP